MVLNSSGANIQTNNYYPFGAVFSQYSGSNSKHLFNGKELQEETDWLDFHARYHMADLGRTTCMGPHAENYYGESSYSFMGNNPIANIDPTGMDYWSTNDPNQIAAFFLALTSGMGDFLSFDYYGWDHATDAGFTGNLTYSDETNTFYSNYGAIRNGEITIVGVSIKGSSLGGKSAGFAGEKGPEWYDQSNGGCVGQPGTWESLIPVWGSGRAAVDHFQNGNYWRAAGHTALAISDVFLVKSIVTGVAKGGVKMLGKSYKTWGSYRTNYGKTGFAAPNQQLHHWAWARNGAKSGEGAGWWAKNQMWNLMPMESQAMHTAVHGWGRNAYGPVGQFWYGTPTWFKASIVSGGGRLAD